MKPLALLDRLRSSQLGRSTAWMISGQGGSVVLQAIYFILIGRTLGSHEYGAFIGCVSLVGVLGQFSSFGQEMLLVRDISRERSCFAIAWGRALAASAFGFAALMTVALIAAHFFLAPGLRILVVISAISDGLFGKVTVLAYRAFQGAGMLDITAKLLIVMNAARVLAAGALMLGTGMHLLRPSALVWTEMYCAASCVVALGSMVYVTATLGIPVFTAPSRGMVVEGLGFSLSSSSISVYNDIDKTFLVGAGQIGAAGIYSAAYRVIDVASTPIYSLYAAAAPRIFKEGVAGAAAASMLPRKLLPLLMLYGLSSALVLYVAAPLLPMVVGAEFARSVEALRWLCLLPLLRGLHYSWGAAITGSSSQWYRTATHLIAAFLNVGLDAWLIPRHSWHGAAVASLLTDGVLAIASWAVLSFLLRGESVRELILNAK